MKRCERSGIPYEDNTDGGTWFGFDETLARLWVDGRQIDVADSTDEETNGQREEEEDKEIQTGAFADELAVEDESSDDERGPRGRNNKPVEWNFGSALQSGASLSGADLVSSSVVTSLHEKIQRRREKRSRQEAAEQEKEAERKRFAAAKKASKRKHAQQRDDDDNDEDGDDNNDEDEDSGSEDGEGGEEEEEEEGGNDGDAGSDASEEPAEPTAARRGPLPAAEDAPADRTRELEAGGEEATARDSARVDMVDPSAYPGVEGDVSSFTELNLSRPLLRALTSMGYVKPTPIQSRAIPLGLAGRDVLGSAVTGSGKTAAFLLPVLERLLYRDRRLPATRVLVLLPTRELATQCFEVCKQLGQYTDIRCALVVGGLSLKLQEAELRTMPDILIATPGRLIDHIQNSQGFDCEDVDVLVLDEADRLLDMGFEAEVEQIVQACPKGRQTMLFSATLSKNVGQLAQLSLHKPARVSADPLFDLSKRLVQEFVRVRSGTTEDREATLLALCTRTFRNKTIVFCTRKKEAHRLALLLGLAGILVAEVHGNLTQRQRLEAMEAFRTGQAHVLVATDLASRGLDITGVETVINFSAPRTLTSYVHRVGRTARAGRGGRAVTLVGGAAGERALMKEAVKRAAQNVQSRQVSARALERCRRQITDMEEDYQAILQEERSEKEMRLADMEARRAENIVAHKDEIQSRPKRTWFQSERTKEAEKEKAKNHAEAEAAAFEKGHIQDMLAGAAVEGRDLTAKEKKQLRWETIKAQKKAEKLESQKKPHRLTRKKRRRMEAMQELANSHGPQDSNDEGEGGGNDSDAGEERPPRKKARNKPMPVSVTEATEDQHRSAKRAKQDARRRALGLGVSSGRAEQIEEGLKQTKERKGRGKGKPGDGSLFAEESTSALHHRPRKGSKGPRTERLAVPAGEPKDGPAFGEALARRSRRKMVAPAKKGSGEPSLLRRGGRPGRHAFKSKARHKRR